MKGAQEQVLAKYSYKKDKPIVSSNNYTVYNATNKQSGLPVTIRILKYPHVELGPYLEKLKNTKSQHVIRVYELVVEQSALIFITEQVCYGNLLKAIQKCKHVQQSDAIFLIKQFLHGHVDLLRSDINWFGTEEDIQFTDGGIKLSWNNGCTFNLVNPFPILINRLTNRNVSEIKGQGESASILPFPKNKLIDELLRISRENASQISMNPQMKKKDKLAKKKGKNWMGLKQAKNKNQYFDQFSYFAVSQQHGFVRVKIYQSGKISPNLLQLNKTKSTFTKIHDISEQNNKTIIVSDYSNDGNLQSYVTKLKTGGIKLKEDQIQFFIYSLFDPIKMVQDSTLKSINMLHIRNIYIENGIPKIGQPVPTNARLEQVLEDRADVPDFYHPSFKKQPTSRDPKYDTYSLGVLLYKLMYTEYPIFPNGKVHIPTTPPYNKRLKQSLQIFLDEGGSLRDIEQRIDVSETVRKKVQQNKAKLNVHQDNVKVATKIEDIDSDQSEHEQKVEEESSSSDSNQQNNQHEDSDDEDGPSWYQIFVTKIQLSRTKKYEDQHRKSFVDQLQLSSFKDFRIWSKCVFVFILYTFLFYYEYLFNGTMLLASQSLLTDVNVTISGNNYTIITTDRYEFELVYNKTSKTVASLGEMHCLVDSGLDSKYSSFINDDSGSWLGYIFGSFGAFGIVLLLKAVQLHTFDEINAFYKRQNGDGHFNMINWILWNLLWLNILTGNYYLFHFVFETQTQPCIGHKQGRQWGSTEAFFNDHNSFIFPFVVIFGLQLIAAMVYLCVISSNTELTKKYNYLLNSVSVFGIILLIFWLIVRFGVIFSQSYYPAATTDSQGVILDMWKQGNFVLFFALIPQFLFVIELIGYFLINWIYFSFVDKTQRLLSNQTNPDASLQALA